ncbi:uncharacterized protein PAF06_013160 [Gastrophryne carolinensis]
MMRIAVSLVVLLVALSILIEAETSRSRAQTRTPGRADAIRRRGNLGQRGRKKTIWSYNPGHRSLAFLVAGEVEVASPPPGRAVTGAEYRCLGCCGEKTPGTGKTTPRPQLSNRVDQILLHPNDLGAIGAEPNSVIDLCLGCCEDGAIPSPRVRTTTRAGRVTKAPAVTRQRPWQAQRATTRERPCVRPHCNPNWRYEASSSSEEVVRRPPPRSRTQLQQSRMGPRCRHLGCRSPLGSIVKDSSSSEEDD